MSLFLINKKINNVILERKHKETPPTLMSDATPVIVNHQSFSFGNLPQNIYYICHHTSCMFYEATDTTLCTGSNHLSLQFLHMVQSTLNMASYQLNVSQEAHHHFHSVLFLQLSFFPYIAFQSFLIQMCWNFSNTFLIFFNLFK